MDILNQFQVGIVIVSYGNPNDVLNCLAALDRAMPEPAFEVFICENAGTKSFERLTDELTKPRAPCKLASFDPTDLPFYNSTRFLSIESLSLKSRSTRVWIALAKHNLGYAGAINEWTKVLSGNPGWEGLWILNPDTVPNADALKALVQHSKSQKKGMVGSTLVPADNTETVHCRGGHRWHKLEARSRIIGHKEPINTVIDAAAIEQKLNIISGASMYLTRTCLEGLGPMDERYFLYYEDLDWSLRAKQYGLGYASASIVVHKGGTTIGSAGNSANRSPLSVYLEIRNRILFVRKFFPLYTLTAYLVSILYVGKYLLTGSLPNFNAALSGLLAALKGEIGRPKSMFDGDSRQKKVLVIATEWWPPAARVAAALENLGYRVASISPPGAAVRQLRYIDKHFRYLPWARRRSVARAISAYQPEFLICADDQAVVDLHKVHTAVSLKKTPSPWMTRLIERSLGKPGSFPLALAKSKFIPYAQSLGVGCPETCVIVDPECCDSFLQTASYPVVIKLDGTSGGRGVLFAANEAEAESAISRFSGVQHVALKEKTALFGFTLSRRRKSLRKAVSVQKYIEGRAANHCVACLNGRVIGSITVDVVRTMGEFGPASVIRIIDHTQMSRAAELIVKDLGLSGFIGFDFMLDKDERAWLLEINPRITPTSHLLLKGGTEVLSSQRDNNRMSLKSIFAEPWPIGTILALFPQELLRASDSYYWRSVPRDVPWAEPALVLSCLRPIVGMNIFRRVRRRLGI